MLTKISPYSTDLVLERMHEVLISAKVDQPRVYLCGLLVTCTFQIYGKDYRICYTINEQSLELANNPVGNLTYSLTRWLKTELAKIDRTETWELVPKT